MFYIVIYSMLPTIGGHIKSRRNYVELNNYRTILIVDNISHAVILVMPGLAMSHDE